MSVVSPPARVRPVPVEQELERVVPMVEAIASQFDVVISVDTSSPEVMTASAAAGAGLINDVRALEREGALEAARATGLPVCLMHRQGEPDSMQLAPRYASVLDEVNAYLQARVEVCEGAGIARERLVLDPGFGFGKSLEHNLQLFARLSDLRPQGLPVLVGVSRKSMIGQVLDRPVDQRLYGSLALAALAVDAGAGIIRVHDVAATRDVVAMAQAVRQARQSQLS